MQQRKLRHNDPMTVKCKQRRVGSRVETVTEERGSGDRKKKVQQWNSRLSLQLKRSLHLFSRYSKALNQLL